MKRLYPYLLFIISLAILITFIFSKSSTLENPKNENKPLSKNDMKNLLLDVSIESLKIDDQEYSINHGNVLKNGRKDISENEQEQVLQLALFYQWAKEDPLFTSPDFDSKQFSKSIELLEKDEKSYMNSIKKDLPFYPIPFLRTIPKVFEKEQKLLSDITLENAKTLIDSYKYASLNYRNEVNKFVKNIKENEKHITDSPYIYINVYTTKKIFFSDLDKIVQNSKALDEEITKRNNCLNEGSNCQRTMLSFKQPTLKEADKENFTPLDFSIIFPNMKPDNYNKIKDPYLVHTPCWGWEDNFSSPSQPIYFFEANQIRKSGTERAGFKLATQNFYRKRGTETFHDKDLTKLGLKDRERQTETNVYMCPSLEYQPMVVTMASFSDKYLFGQINEKDIPKDYLSFWKQAKIFEENYFKKNPKVDQDLEDLSKAYSFAYKILGESDANQKIRNEFLGRHLIASRKLSKFHLITNAAHQQFSFILLAVNGDPKYFSDERNVFSAVYPSRSLWNLLYFPFSPSFWRLDQKPQYLKNGKIDNKKSLKDKEFITYQEALTLYNASEINSWAKIQQDYFSEMKDNLNISN